MKPADGGESTCCLVPMKGKPRHGIAGATCHLLEGGRAFIIKIDVFLRYSGKSPNRVVSNMDIRKLSQDIQAETEKIIVGKSDRIRLVIMAVLADGHILLDDLPGVGKTTLVKTISIALGCRSGRIQFVPDMLPSDIIGMNIYNQKTGDFELRQGPVMTNLLLADEINRAIPRTQSALLEAMEERQISIDGERFPLPAPFLVLAT